MSPRRARHAARAAMARTRTEAATTVPIRSAAAPVLDPRRHALATASTAAPAAQATWRATRRWEIVWRLSWRGDTWGLSADGRGNYSGAGEFKLGDDPRPSG